MEVYVLGGKKIRIVLTPGETLPDVDVWLVVDLLRASSTAVAFFEHGGKKILPVSSVEEARRLKANLGDNWILMGERKALPIEGFDLGNSPLAFEYVHLKDKAGAVMTTSNGTLAYLKAASTGKAVFVAAARNAYHAARRALKLKDTVGILCAGKEGRLALDDCLCAGLLLEEILKMAGNVDLDDGAKVVSALWEFYGKDLGKGVYMSESAKLLMELGMKEDIEYCCKVNCSFVVPTVVLLEGRPCLLLQE
ncbi:MAG TPA: 2-phosphosulfolactate phosphatase [Thermovirga lienii]|nr:2-phosphosulfolactate phosphatase [Thermovirga lienii]